jgi:hypothetical protein
MFLSIRVGGHVVTLILIIDIIWSSINMSSNKAKLKFGMLASMVVLESWIKDSSLVIMDVVAHFQQLANFLCLCLRCIQSTIRLQSQFRYPKMNVTLEKTLINFNYELCFYKNIMFL